MPRVAIDKERRSMQVSPLPVSLPTPPATPATPPVTPPAPVGFDHIFDFPGLHAGDRYSIMDGSTAGGISVRGEARFNAFSPTSADVWIKAGRFGFNKEATLQVQQVSPTQVKITVREPGAAPSEALGDIVDVRTDYSEFRGAAGSALAGVARLQREPGGRLVLDASGMRDVLDGATAHLVLERRR
jgi:hypothetical protein